MITYPPVRQDLAFSVPEEVAAGDLVAAAREAAGAELREMRAFDVYRGEQVGPGPEVGRVLGRVPVAGAHALRRGRGAGCAARSSTPSGSASAPSFAPKKLKTDPRLSAVLCLRCRVTGSRSLLLLAVVAALGGPAAADNPVLQARVGENDSFAITLTDATGAKVTHLDPGDYTIHVNDLSDMHNFDLTGPGVSKSTGVTRHRRADVERHVHERHVQVRLRRARDDHEGSVHRRNRADGCRRQEAVGGVGPGAHISLDALGEGGQDRADDPRSQRRRTTSTSPAPGVNKKTGVAFTGTVKWTVTLKAGTYTFRSDAHKALKGTLKVS